jgi:arylsulfatase A-like enzyme
MAHKVHRRDLFRMSLLPLLAGCGGAKPKPNIVVILADDLGYGDLGFQGAPDIPTPHIDSLAATGVRCTSGYVTHPFCSPARAALLTGRYQQRYGHENNMVFDLGDEVAGLPLSEVTLADLLGEAGYVTGLVGKWHLGAHPRFHPSERGFQKMYGFIGGGHDYFDPGSADATDQHFLLLEHDGRKVLEMDYLTTDLGYQAGEFVRRHQGQPFFLYLSFNAPHTPLQAPETYLERFSGIADEKRRTYAAMVSAMDDAVGMTLAALREAGVEDRTLIFFLNDNGGPTGNASSNRPLRGTKRTLYEGGVRVPFVVRWPGRVPEGGVYDQPVSSLDVLPTSLAAAGLPLPAGIRLDGVNLLPYLEGEAAGPPHSHLFWRTFGGVHFAVRADRYKLVRNPGSPAELYDLETDIGETRDLAREKPEVVQRLEAALEEWNREMVEPLWKDHIFHRQPSAS